MSDDRFDTLAGSERQGADTLMGATREVASPLMPDERRRAEAVSEASTFPATARKDEDSPSVRSAA